MLFWLQKRAGGAGDDDISPSRPLRPVPTKAGCGICHLAALGMKGTGGDPPRVFMHQQLPPPRISPLPEHQSRHPKGRVGGQGTSSWRGRPPIGSAAHPPGGDRGHPPGGDSHRSSDFCEQTRPKSSDIATPPPSRV